MSRFILGTANFEGKYGIRSNEVLSGVKLQEIIAFAQNEGINHFDTAANYGEAELKLGELLQVSDQLKVDSKISDKDCQTVDSMINAVSSSINRLKVNKLSTLYLHNASSLLGKNRTVVKSGLNQVLNQGLAEFVGVSAYTLRDLIDCKDAHFELTRFQVPENICDRRLFKAKEMMELVMNDNIINVRSIFLQGLLLMDPRGVPGALEKSRPSLLDLELFSKSSRISQVDLCIAYSKAIPWASKIVIGVDSVAQLKEILKSNYKLIGEWEKNISVLAPEIVDPRNWKA